MINNIGEQLKKKRKEKKLTLEQAGKLIGVSKVTYREYELNKIKNARMDKLVAIANFLEVSPEELFFEEKNNICNEKITSIEFQCEVRELLNKTIDLSDQEKQRLINNIDSFLEILCNKEKDK